MSIFRTVKKITDCPACLGRGTVEDGKAEVPCPQCDGSGRIEVVIRASAASVARAEKAIPEVLPPSQRKAAKTRLRGDEAAPAGKVGKGYIDE